MKPYSLNQSQQKYQQQLFAQLKSFQPQQAIINRSELIPPNFTLVAWPNQSILTCVQKLYHQIQNIDPGQQLYPLSSLHLTLLGGLDNQLDPATFISSIKRFLPRYNLRFHLLGINSYIHHSSISAYPINYSLHQIRQNLRKSLGIYGDNYSKYIPAFEYVGWINFLKYNHPPKPELLNFFLDNNNQYFGTFTPHKFQILKTTHRLLASEHTQIIYTYNA